MIKTSTDVSIVAMQLVAWSVLLLLSYFEAVLTTPYLIAVLITGMALLTSGYFQLGTQSYSSLTRPRETNVFVGRGIYRNIRHPIYFGIFL
jgi:protein-S-isoprenylcysteine O-methyltransferase Ste14